MVENFKNKIFKCASSFDVFFILVCTYDESNKIMQMKTRHNNKDVKMIDRSKTKKVSTAISLNLTG
jgi:hypothetical protein